MRYSERIVDSTKPGKYFLLVVFLTLLSAITAFGQSKEEKKLRVQAVKALRAENFSAAKEIYTDLLKLDPNNPDYNYEMGLAIYEEGIHRGKAAPYLERAIQNTKSDTLAEMFLFAGKSEQYGGNFDLAIGYYNDYLKFMSHDGFEPQDLEEDIERYIEMCENGKVQFENNKDFIRIENMGGNINSVYQDYAPVVTNDESIILFTSRRENSTGGEIDIDGKYFEDIYYSLNVDGTYTPAANTDSTNRIMSNGVNTDYHDATITFASDETQLFIYRDQHVWVSQLEDGVWTMPTKALGRINSEKGFEPSVFITQDEETMFVVSDISSGLGGRDIYVTTKDDNGQWKPLESLGRMINSEYDEDAPFLTPDGNTLYYASNGHNSMGDYDIFKSELDEQGNWGPAENLGHPINTPGHDRYFVTSDDGAVGFYASDRDGGYGETDIYRIILDCKAVSATMISGIVFSEDKGGPVATDITIFDPRTNVVLNTYKTDEVTGKYEMRLKTEKTYGFKINAEGYLPHAGEFTVPKQCDYFTLFQEIKIDNLEDSNGQVYAQRASINNAFFNVDKKMEEDFADIEVEKLAESQKDSLRSVIAENYNPIELTNYVKLIDIVDPNGVRLASEYVGATPVSRIQARDHLDVSYEAKIAIADDHFYSEKLAEARANYMIANKIKPKETYPVQQVEIIDTKLEDAPESALLSSLSDEEKAEIEIPVLVDSVGTRLDPVEDEDWEGLSEQYSVSQGVLKRMTPEQLKRLKEHDSYLDYVEETGELGEQEKSGQVAMSKEDASMSGMEEEDGGLSYQEEDYEALSEQYNVSQEILKRMTPEQLKRLKEHDSYLDYVEETGELGEQEKSGQVAMSKEDAAMSGMEEEDGGLSYQEADYEALSEQYNVSQEILKRMTPEQLKRMKEYDSYLDYVEETGELGEQEKSGQVAMTKEEATMNKDDEEDSSLSVKPSAMDEETIVFRNILFDFDKSELRKESIVELNKVTAYMEKEAKVEVQIDGHADWIGTVEYNMALSERRAKEAYEYIAKKGISENRLTFQYFGEAVPIAPNANEDGTDNPEGRQLNRRCEFKIDQTGTADNVVLKF